MGRQAEPPDVACFCLDLILHIGLGFGINEVYIMAAHWAYVIPMACGCLLKGLSHKPRRLLYGLLLALTLCLWIYNGGLTVYHLLNF